MEVYVRISRKWETCRLKIKAAMLLKASILCIMKSAPTLHLHFSFTHLIIWYIQTDSSQDGTQLHLNWTWHTHKYGSCWWLWDRQTVSLRPSCAPAKWQLCLNFQLITWPRKLISFQLTEPFPGGTVWKGQRPFYSPLRLRVYRMTEVTVEQLSPTSGVCAGVMRVHREMPARKLT